MMLKVEMLHVFHNLPVEAVFFFFVKIDDCISF